MYTWLGPPHSLFFSVLLQSSPHEDALSQPHAASQQDSAGLHSCSRGGLGPFLPPAGTGMSVGHPPSPGSELQQEQGTEREVHTPGAVLCTWRHLAAPAAPGSSGGISAVTGPSVCQQHPWASQPHLRFHRKKSRHKVHRETHRNILWSWLCFFWGQCLSRGFRDMRVTKSLLQEGLLQYYKHYSITFAHQINLGIFFRSGPLAIAISVTAETNQMELDRPQHRTSARQSSYKNLKTSMKRPRNTSIFRNKQMPSSLV